jgi:alcohol dehydrogenase (NADP+)
MNTYAFAAQDATSPLAPFRIKRRDVRPCDVSIDILFCGVCHTDLHFARNDWKMTEYPVVPGHEIVGRVREVGSDVTRFKVGDVVAVGTYVDSCQQCEMCRRHLEVYCRNGVTPTYNGLDRISGGMTYGGYSDKIVVREEMVLSVPESLDISRVGPLLCAGITTYSPLRTWNAGPGTRVGVIGVGGLGHLAIKFAAALGAEVTAITRSDKKSREAYELGADHVLVSTSEAAMKEAASGFDLIIDTVPYQHELAPYIELLDIDGTLAVVGALADTSEFSNAPVILGRRRIAGSAVGGIREMQEMLDLCAKKNILPECELITMDRLGEAFDRMERGDVHYRFVLDMASLKDATADSAFSPIGVDVEA